MKALVVVSAALALVAAAFIPHVAAGTRQNPESFYQSGWCKDRGQMEVKLASGDRVDCLTGNHAIEFEHASKWHEAIGQAMFYGMLAGKAPGIVFILERENDKRLVGKAILTIENYQLPISVWVIRPDGRWNQVVPEKREIVP